MRPLARTTLLATFALALAACAHGGGSARREQKRADLITAKEMELTHWASLYDLVRELRPNWLNNRGPDRISGSPTQVQVVLDGMRFGDVDKLRDLPASGYEYLQYFDPITASGRWGLGFSSGAIYVASRHR